MAILPVSTYLTAVKKKKKKRKEEKKKRGKNSTSLAEISREQLQGVIEQTVGDASSNQPLSPWRCFSIMDLVVAGVKAVALLAARHLPFRVLSGVASAA